LLELKGKGDGLFHQLVLGETAIFTLAKCENFLTLIMSHQDKEL